MGSANEKIRKNDKALIYYNEAIEIEAKFRGNTMTLGELFRNRSIAQRKTKEKVEDLWQSVYIFLKLGCPKEVAESYIGLGSESYGSQDYIDALYYYLISYNLLLFNADTNQIRLVEQSIWECLRLNLKMEDFSSNMRMYLSIFYHITKKKELSCGEWDEILTKSLGIWTDNLKECMLANDIDEYEEEISSELYIIFPYIKDFYDRNGCLPFDNAMSIKTIILAIYCYGNRSLYEYALNIINEFKSLTGFEKWELRCFYLYFRNELIPLQSAELEIVMKKIRMADLKRGILEEDELVTSFLACILYEFACKVFIPNKKYELGLKVANIICLIDSENPYFLDKKAEILYRIGKNIEAIEIVKSIVSIAPNFYPSENEYIFNAIVKKL